MLEKCAGEVARISTIRLRLALAIAEVATLSVRAAGSECIEAEVS